MVNSQNTLLRVVNETDTPVSLASNTALGIARNFNPNAITQLADFYEETECPSCTGNEQECPDGETAPVLPDADSSNQCPSTTIQHCDSCVSTGQSEVTSIDRSSQCNVDVRVMIPQYRRWSLSTTCPSYTHANKFDTKKQNLMSFESKYNHFKSGKYVWKCKVWHSPWITRHFEVTFVVWQPYLADMVGWLFK